MTLLQSKQSPMFGDGFIAKKNNNNNNKKNKLLCSIYSIVKSKEPLSIYIYLSGQMNSLWTHEKICSQIISSCMPFFTLSFQRQALF